MSTDSSGFCSRDADQLSCTRVRAWTICRGCPAASAKYRHSKYYFDAGRSAACCAAFRAMHALESMSCKLELHAARLTACPLLQEEEEGIGDVDLFTLNEDGSRLQVNPKWLQHLQVICLACPCTGPIYLLHLVTPRGFLSQACI